MTRIAKSDVYAALAKAGKNIVAAGGDDGVTSRKELQAHVKTIDNKTEAALTRLLFSFIDHRDHVAGARVTEKDVKKAIGYAKEHLVANRDVNNNGLSASEVRNLSNLGKLAVKLAEEVQDLRKNGMSTTELGKAINVAMKDVNWISESDSTPQFIAVPFREGQAVNTKNVLSSFKELLKKEFTDSDVALGDLTAEIEPLTAKDLKELATAEENDPDSRVFAEGFKRFKTLAESNLKDMVSVKIGPKDRDGSLATDQGYYVRLMVGRTKDDKLAGIHFSVVET